MLRAACLALVAAALLAAGCAGAVVYETRSAYSHIRVVDAGTQRALYFVGEADVDVVETLMDMRAPHRLQHAYSKTVMAALLYRPEPRSALLIGLGGGAIVRFLNHHWPTLRLDVIEIDPVVVDVAQRWFGTVAQGATRIHVADGRDWLERSRERYDLILVDAHLHPGALTDATGHPLSLKGEAFFRSVRDRLEPDGIVMFNVIGGPDAEAYLSGIRRAFPAHALYWPAATRNVLVFATPGARLADDATLRARARRLDANEGYGFSFERVLGERAPAPGGAGR